MDIYGFDGKRDVLTVAPRKTNDAKNNVLVRKREIRDTIHRNGFK